MKDLVLIFSLIVAVTVSVSVVGCEMWQRMADSTADDPTTPTVEGTWDEATESTVTALAPWLPPPAGMILSGIVGIILAELRNSANRRALVDVVKVNEKLKANSPAVAEAFHTNGVSIRSRLGTATLKRVTNIREGRNLPLI